MGSPVAIVMGISGNPSSLLDLTKVKKDQIPVLQRFSGGGTVIVDQNTLFISFILGKNSLEIPAFPEPILRWSANLYKDAWKIPGFELKENDYVISNHKCGGNAQYIKKDKWLHHTSFLFDYQPENMDYLLLPSKRPKYRQDRPHNDFLCRLKNWEPNPLSLIEKLKKSLVKQFYIQDLQIQNLEKRPHRQAVRELTF